MNDTELDELERFEALVRGPGWTPDIDKHADYEEWTGKWYTPPRPDGTGGCSLALYADDEEILYAKYIAALRNAAPCLIRAARHLAEFDKEGLRGGPRATGSVSPRQPCQPAGTESGVPLRPTLTSSPPAQPR